MIASDYPLQRQTLSSLSKRLWLAAVFLNKKVICAHTHTPPPLHIYTNITQVHTQETKSTCKLYMVPKRIQRGLQESNTNKRENKIRKQKEKMI